MLKLTELKISFTMILVFTGGIFPIHRFHCNLLIPLKAVSTRAVMITGRTDRRHCAAITA